MIWNVISTQANSAEVFFINRDTAISVGWGGNIFKSTDGGISWMQKNSGTTTSLYRVDFPDNNTGFAVGFFGKVVKTTDGGENWTVIDIGASSNLWDVKFANRTKGFIVGHHGNIFATTDGGITWHPQHYYRDIKLFHINFINDSTGYITGEGGLMLKTVNGGFVSVGSQMDILKSFSLYQNYPNPFNPVTKIRFDIAEPSEVKLTVYDLLGCEVSTLIDSYLYSGSYETEFSAYGISSGMYFYTLKAGKYMETKKLILLK